MSVPSPVDDLPVARQALLELLLKRGKSYGELADMLRIQPERLRERSRAAIELLGPIDGPSPSPAHQSAIADYLLGQQPRDAGAETQRFLAGSEEARAWADAVSGRLRAAGLPPRRTVADIPDSPVGHAEAVAPPAPTAGPKRSRRYGASGVAMLALAGVLAFLVTGAGRQDNRAAASPTLTEALTASSGVARFTVLGPTRLMNAVEGARAISTRSATGYYPLYAAAHKAFGVNVLLLASIHFQETELSTAPGTYEGRNYAGCCAGPMQFSVVDHGSAGSVWSRFADAYRAGGRPRYYPHQTRTHPSVYDDFDAIMGAALLLKTSGAGETLDSSAWSAAYDFHGHDAAGVRYADEVVARAVQWAGEGVSVAPAGA